MERLILQQPPSIEQFAGINACRRRAWERKGQDYYPYHAFSEYESWQESGELGKAIQSGELSVSVVVDEKSEIVAHAALVRNKFGVELGRVFSQRGGHGYGIQAVDKAREHAEALQINEIHMGVSYNRTAMWRAYEETFAQHGWKMAVLGILPDIYHEHDMQWGEIISRAVKEGSMQLPLLSADQPDLFRQFAQEIQRINNHCIKFKEGEQQMPREMPLPYQFSDNVYALSWHDFQNQQKYLSEGYLPVGLIKIHNEWQFVVYKGNLPEKVEGRGVDLQFGRNPVIYPKSVAQVPVHEVIKSIYKE